MVLLSLPIEPLIRIALLTIDLSTLIAFSTIYPPLQLIAHSPQLRLHHAELKREDAIISASGS